MEMKAQCKNHREVNLNLFSSRVQLTKAGANDLIFVAEPCFKCIHDAKLSAIQFTYNEMQRQAVSYLTRKKEVGEK